MSNEDLILSKIDGLTTLVKANYKNSEKRMETHEREIERNKGSIAHIYEIQRVQEDTMGVMKEEHLKCGAEVREKIKDVENKPAIEMQKNMKAIMWKLIGAVVLTVAGVTVIPKIVGMFGG